MPFLKTFDLNFEKIKRKIVILVKYALDDKIMGWDFVCFVLHSFVCMSGAESKTVSPGMPILYSILLHGTHPLRQSTWNKTFFIFHPHPFLINLLRVNGTLSYYSGGYLGLESPNQEVSLKGPQFGFLSGQNSQFCPKLSLLTESVYFMNHEQWNQ